MTTLYKPGDAIRGERVICTCRKAKDPELIRLTNAHRGSRVTLIRDVYCMIEREFMMTTPNSTTPQS